MHITINLDTTDTADLSALTALVARLTDRVSVGSLVIEPATAEDNEPTKLSESVGPAPDTSAVEQDDDSDEYPVGLSKECAENPEGAPDTDSRGLPWDERIHAGTKATNADGTWRNRRGVDKELVAEVEAELRGAPEAPAPAADAPEPPAPDVPEAPPANAPTFKDAMARVTAGQRDGTVTQAQVAEAAQALGLASVVDLAKPANAHLIEGFIAALG